MYGPCFVMLYLVSFLVYYILIESNLKLYCFIYNLQDVTHPTNRLMETLVCLQTHCQLPTHVTLVILYLEPVKGIARTMELAGLIFSQVVVSLKSD